MSKLRDLVEATVRQACADGAVLSGVTMSKSQDTGKVEVVHFGTLGDISVPEFYRMLADILEEKERKGETRHIQLQRPM